MSNKNSDLFAGLDKVALLKVSAAAAFAVSLLVHYFGQSFFFLFVILLFGIHGQSPLGLQEKIPSYAAICLIALLAVGGLQSGGSSYEPASVNDHWSESDGRGSYMMGNSKCSFFSGPDGRSYKSCD